MLFSLRILSLGVLFVLVSCGGRSQGPSATLQAYSAALRGGDYDAAYELMSESFREEHSKEEFVRMMRDSDVEVRETASRLRGKHESVEISAEYEYDMGYRMRLIYEDGAWRIASNPLAFYSQATPRDALISFLLAYKLKRWDIMLRFVPSKYRERMTPEMLKRQFEGENRDEIANMMRVLESHVGVEIIHKGTEARMPYGDHYEVKFIREDEDWKIRDFD